MPECRRSRSGRSRPHLRSGTGTTVGVPAACLAAPAGRPVPRLVPAADWRPAAGNQAPWDWLAEAQPGETGRPLAAGGEVLLVGDRCPAGRATAGGRGRVDLYRGEVAKPEVAPGVEARDQRPVGADQVGHPGPGQHAVDGV